MRTKENTALPNQTLNLDSDVKPLKRSSSWSHFEQSRVISHASNNSIEGQSHTPSTDQTALPESSDSGNSMEEVNWMAKGINMMHIKDPKETRQTNQVPCSYRGLPNLGATCYLNATLQVLFMTKAFRERVLLGAPSETNGKLESALKEIFEELSNQARGATSVSTHGIINSLGIQRNEQQDAVEYFLDILEKVGPDLAKVFSGTLRNIRICSKKHKSHDDSPFKSLQIPVIIRDGSFTLEDGVSKYFESTKLVADDQMYCETCDEKRDTEWSCEIHEYPTILPLHLKRFVYDYGYGFVKNDCPMDVPLHLSLQEHEYSLYAVINHTGSRFGGHYTAVIQSFTDNKWYCFDDSRVTETDESKLKRSGEAYLLLYQKINLMKAAYIIFALMDYYNPCVEDMKEEPKTKTAEPEEAGEADRAECGGAHDKPQLEVSVVTDHLRILVLNRPETDIKTLVKILCEVSPESQLQHGETIKDSLEMCTPGPHMVLWVAPLMCNKKDKEAFEEIYRFMGNKSSKYIMIVFTCKGHPKKELIKKDYTGINNHVLDIGADLFVQVKELVTKLQKTVDENHKLKSPYYVMKPRKVKHKKTEASHEKKASKRKDVIKHRFLTSSKKLKKR